MNDKPESRLWVYITAIPSLFALTGILLTSLAYAQLWGGSTRAAQVFAIFFAEVSLVISAGGLLAYHLRVQHKTLLPKILSRINWCIIFSAIVIGLYLFLG